MTPAILGKNIRKARNRKCMTQTALGEAIGIKRAYMCEIEQGGTRISVFRAYDLAKILGTTVEELLLK